MHFRLATDVSVVSILEANSGQLLEGTATMSLFSIIFLTHYSVRCGSEPGYIT